MKNLHDKAYMRSYRREVAIRVLSFFVAVVTLVAGYGYVSSVYRKQNLQLLHQSVQRTAVECYSIEGIYPPNVEYLEEHYSLVYDHSKYFVFYDTFASNVMPVIEVYEKE